MKTVMFSFLTLALAASIVSSTNVCPDGQYYGDGDSVIDISGCGGVPTTRVNVDIPNWRTKKIADIPTGANTVRIDVYSSNGDIDTLLMKEGTNQQADSSTRYYGECYAGYACSLGQRYSGCTNIGPRGNGYPATNTMRVCFSGDRIRAPVQEWVTIDKANQFLKLYIFAYSVQFSGPRMTGHVDFSYQDIDTEFCSSTYVPQQCNNCPSAGDPLANGCQNPTCDGSTQIGCACAANPTSIANYNSGATSCANTPSNGQCSIVCNTGYYASSLPYCQIDGSWDNTGSCSRKKCTTNPTHISNMNSGGTNCVNTLYEGTCYFGCNGGYYRSGTATCTNPGGAGEQWTGGSCAPYTCANDPPVSNMNGAATSCEGTSGNGGTCTVVCASGYTTNDATATCNAGSWTSTPVCSPAPCSGNPTYANVDDSASSCDNTASGATCAFSCDSGYVASGVATCSLGSWDNLNGCDERSCTRADLLSEVSQLASGTCDNTPSGSSCTIRCDGDFTGSGSADCLRGSWTNNGECMQNVRCGPPAVTNGAYDATNYPSPAPQDGDDLVESDITCDDGYQRTATVAFICVCQDLNQPCSDLNNACEEIQCSDLTVSVSGSTAGTDGTCNGAGATSSPSCDLICGDGFYFAGANTVTCDLNGNWGSMPTCAEYMCPTIATTAFETQAGANCTGGGASGSPQCQFECAEGYSISGGSDTITCGFDGSWPSYPTCVANSCTPSDIPNTDMAAPGSIVGVTGDIVTVTCDEGYTGPFTIGATNNTGGTVECQANGAFTSFTCSPNPCATAFVAFSQYNVWDETPLSGSTGDEIMVTCNADITTGGGIATCLPSGVFSDVVCTPKTLCAYSYGNPDRVPAGTMVPDRTVDANEWSLVNGNATATYLAGVGALLPSQVVFDDKNVYAQTCINNNACCNGVCVDSQSCEPSTPTTTAAPTPNPATTTTAAPTPNPTPTTTAAPTPNPATTTTAAPTPNPTPTTTAAPTPNPTPTTTAAPTPNPTPTTTAAPTPNPTTTEASAVTTEAPTPAPTDVSITVVITFAGFVDQYVLDNLETVKAHVLASIIAIFDSTLTISFESFVQANDRRSRSLAAGEWTATFTMTGSSGTVASARTMANNPNNGIADEVRGRLDSGAYDSGNFGAQSSASDPEEASSEDFPIVIVAGAAAGAVVVIVVVLVILLKRGRKRNRAFSLKGSGSGSEDLGLKNPTATGKDTWHSEL